MQNPATYQALFNNISRLCHDAELLLRYERYASANGLAILAIEEAGKFTSLMLGAGERDSRDHKKHQQTMGEFFDSVAVFEAVAREIEGMLEHLRVNSPQSYAEAIAMQREELIRFAIASLESDPSFDMQKFIRRVVGDDDSTRFAMDVSGNSKYHQERLNSTYVDYDSSGNLTSDPSTITKERAERRVELAWFAMKLQDLWFGSWKRHQEPAS